MFKFRFHPSIKKIKQNFNVNEKFTFQQVTVNDVGWIIYKLPKNKAASGHIPLKVSKESNLSFEELTNWTKYAFSHGKFPDSLKIDKTKTKTTDTCNWQKKLVTKQGISLNMLKYNMSFIKKVSFPKS